MAVSFSEKVELALVAAFLVCTGLYISEKAITNVTLYSRRKELFILSWLCGPTCLVRTAIFGKEKKIEHFLTSPVQMSLGYNVRI